MDKIIIEILVTIRPDFDFINSTNYIEDGGLDSFDIVNLVNELDSYFKVSIPGSKIISNNFLNKEKIQELIENLINNLK